MAPGGRFHEAGLLRVAAHMPEVLDQMGYRAPTTEPIVTLPNGRALHRWPPSYLTADVQAFVGLWRTAAGRAIADGGVLGWPAWLADAVAFLDGNQKLSEAQRG